MVSAHRSKDTFCVILHFKLTNEFQYQLVFVMWIEKGAVSLGIQYAVLTKHKNMVKFVNL